MTESVSLFNLGIAERRRALLLDEEEEEGEVTESLSCRGILESQLIRVLIHHACEKSPDLVVDGAEFSSAFQYLVSDRNIETANELYDALCADPGLLDVLGPKNGERIIAWPIRNALIQSIVPNPVCFRKECPFHLISADFEPLFSSREDFQCVNCQVTITPFPEGGIVLDELGSKVINSGWHDSQIELVPVEGRLDVRVRVWGVRQLSLGLIDPYVPCCIGLFYDSLQRFLGGSIDGRDKSERRDVRKCPSALFYALGCRDSTNMGAGHSFSGIIHEFKVFAGMNRTNEALLCHLLPDGDCLPVVLNEADRIAFEVSSPECAPPVHSEFTLPIDELLENFASYSSSVLFSSVWNENASFLIENIEMLADAQVVIRQGQLEEVVFRCFRSLFPFQEDEVGGFVPVAGTDGVKAHSFSVVLDESTSLRLTEESFLGFLFGLKSVDDLMLNDVALVLNLYEIFHQLGMKELLADLCERVARGRSDFGVTYGLFRDAFEKYENEVEDFENVDFRSALSLAAYLALRKKLPELNQSNAKIQKTWLIRNLLFECLSNPNPSHILRNHPSVDGVSSISSPVEYVRTQFVRCSVRQSYPNLELHSKMDLGVVDAHVEALVLAYDFLKLMLRFAGKEKATFTSKRTIVLDDLPSASIKMLVYFAYTGKLPSGSQSLFDLLHLLLHAERFQSHALVASCIRVLTSFDTRDPTFLDELQAVGKVFNECVLKVEIVDAWASQGCFAREFLLTTTSESVQSQELQEENDRLRAEVELLTQKQRETEEILQEHRGLLEDLLRRIKILEKSGE